MSLQKVMLDNPNIFPEKFVNFETFRGVYAQVMSRVLSWGIDSPSMVPVADLFNHMSGYHSKMALEKMTPENVFNQFENFEENDALDDSVSSGSDDEEEATQITNFQKAIN